MHTGKDGRMSIFLFIFYLSTLNLTFDIYCDDTNVCVTPLDYQNEYLHYGLGLLLWTILFSDNYVDSSHFEFTTNNGQKMNFPLFAFFLNMT